MTGHTLDLGHRDDVVVADLQGEVDMSNAAVIGDELLAAVPHDAVGLVVDMSGLRYLDSAGVSMLFELVRQLDSTRQRLGLVVPNPSVLHRLIEVTNLSSVATVRTHMDACIEGVRETATDLL